MRILSCNCRGLKSPATIPQLKESLRLFKPGLVFVYETKTKRVLWKLFVGNWGRGRDGILLSQ